MPFNFQRLHDFHDHRYVLTTQNNVGRQIAIAKSLEGWDLEFFYGIDKSDYSIERFTKEKIYSEAHARKNDRRNKAMTVGHICCSLGHRLIYEDFLKREFERVIIFEDDAYPILEAESRLKDALSAFPKDAEMIYWGWHGNESRPSHGSLKQVLYHAQHTLGLERYNHKMISNLYPREYNNEFERAGKHFCAHAYTLTRKGAEKLIRWQTPITYNADNAIMYAILNDDVRGYISKTQFFDQTSLNNESPSLTAD